MRAPDDR